VVANNSPATITVLLGNGEGSFQSPVTYSAGGTGSARLAIADLNGDGHLDVVVANYACTGCSDSGVAVLLGNGNGTFQPAVSYHAAGKKGFSVAIGDVNADGRLDLVVTNVDTNSVGVLLGNGDGTFQPVTLFDSGGSSDFSVGIADLNSDSHPDLVVANWCAQYCPNGNGEGSISVLLNNFLGLNFPTTTTLVSSPNPSIFGQPVTFTAQVRSGEGTPAGIAMIFDGSIPIANLKLANGKNSGPVSFLAVGSHPIAAKYEGSLRFSPSISSSIKQTVDTATTTTSLLSSLNPASTGKTVTFTATVAGLYGGAAVGSVIFRDGSSMLATAKVASNQASYSTSSLSRGVHSITATYSGDANNRSSPSALLTQYITGASRTVLITSESPTWIRQPVTFTATVTSAFGRIPDGELLTFYDGTAMLGSSVLAGGSAAYTTSSLSAKNHTIKAVYTGDTIFSPSSGAVSQVVNPYPTTTALTTSPNPSYYGGPVILRAQVTVTGPTGPTGWVVFKNGTTGLGTVLVNATGIATQTKTTLPLGSSSITATYNGDTINAKSTSSAVVQTVSQAQITMTIKSWSNPTKKGQSVLFTATLTSNGGLPNGQMVAFSYNGNPLGTAKISGGKANLWISTLPVGSGVVTATYAGDANHSSGTASLTQTVN
jgi:hypothetical protein